MTNEQHEILRHALGLSRNGSEYRNHFVTGPGSTDYPHCEALVAAGLMTKRPGHALTGGDSMYVVTEEGKTVARSKTRTGPQSNAMKQSARRWRCRSCHRIVLDHNLLTAPSPFDDHDTLTGCPNCKACQEGFDLVCDEQSCDNIASSGWPTGNQKDVWGGYRHTCHEHDRSTA